MSGCNVTFSINYIIFSFCDSSEENIVANSYTSLTLSVYYTHFLHHCTALLSLVYIFSKHELLKAISMRSLFVFHYSHFAGLKFCNVDWVYWRLSVSNIYEFTTYSIFSTELIDKIFIYPFLSLRKVIVCQCPNANTSGRWFLLQHVGPLPLLPSTVGLSIPTSSSHPSPHEHTFPSCSHHSTIASEWLLAASAKDSSTSPRRSAQHQSIFSDPAGAIAIPKAWTHQFRKWLWC